MIYEINAPTLTPDESVELGLKRPICGHKIVEPILDAFMDSADFKVYGFKSFFLTLLQIVYNAGRIEGIRAERKKKAKDIA